MRAVTMNGFGDPSVLTMGDVPRPTLADGEILIRVTAAGVNRPDILQRRGMYPPPKGASEILGLEVAGIVEERGPGTDGMVKKGARVMALLPGGGYAEYATVDARHVIPLPDILSDEEGAALPETLYTVWTNVFEAGAAQPSETLFVHGATSGIGTMAATLGRAFGLTVMGTAGTDAKCRWAEENGYARCFNYRTDDWSSLMQDTGADVVLDMVGGDYVGRNLTFLRPGGRHVSIAFQGGMEARFNIIEVMQKRLTLTGSTLRARPAAEKARLTAEITRVVGPRLGRGDVRPIIDRSFPLEQAAAAHEHLESGEIAGKVILTL
ncbi:NAD(P)H-quinone oxidoreductase [Parvularcula sp. LCG005]|uniref:NAD(P)H-quinone oxidoreductase n=1 Tax=Parvularcula sp. LCG005 TaxID=3078805 RepID=UPI0029424BBD|nr:NAD(P)H-quinone oxidoreductase [Parvularcula sp. LCG005]WOI53763.1 NAD(P)H-quinone oxidoreductase [Parvularcula sp. LCG005]